MGQVKSEGNHTRVGTHASMRYARNTILFSWSLLRARLALSLGIARNVDANTPSLHELFLLAPIPFDQVRNLHISIVFSRLLRNQIFDSDLRLRRKRSRQISPESRMALTKFLCTIFHQFFDVFDDNCFFFFFFLIFNRATFNWFARLKGFPAMMNRRLDRAIDQALHFTDKQLKVLRDKSNDTLSKGIAATNATPSSNIIATSTHWHKLTFLVFSSPSFLFKFPTFLKELVNKLFGIGESVDYGD